MIDAIPGTRVVVWFWPWNLDIVWYGPEMKPAKLVDLTQNAQYMKLQYMNEYETRLFIENRLKNAEAPPHLFEQDAIDIWQLLPEANAE